MNYIDEAVQTLSNQFHGDKIAIFAYDEALRNAIYALKNLDAIKKTLFYGKELPPQLDHNMQLNKNCNGLPSYFKTDAFGEVMIHGILGMATEAGEMLELLFKTTIQGQEFDGVNLSEEVGDSFWYAAVLARFAGFTFEGVQETNIAKLRKRYPDKFTAYDAINRDEAAERVVLENHAPHVPFGDEHYAWDCKIGSLKPLNLPKGSDAHMREAVHKAYVEITGEEPIAIFSGWGAQFTEVEKDVIKGFEKL